jgi:DNA-binding transcriptional LysR family regulator
MTLDQLRIFVAVAERQHLTQAADALALQASQTIASYWLPSLLVRFRETHPQIDVRLDVGNTQSVADAVREGQADLGLVEGGVDDAALVAEGIGQDRMAIVVAPGHPWARKRRLTAADLQAARWIMREQGSGTRSALEEMLVAQGADLAALQIALTQPSPYAVRAAVMSAGFVAGLSELVAAPYIAAGLLAKVRVDLPPRDFFLLRHRERYRSRAAQAFEALVRTA